MLEQALNVRQRKHRTAVLWLLAGTNIWTLHFVVAYVAISFGCAAGMPQTPPPACVPELPLYRPAIGVRWSA